MLYSMTGFGKAACTVRDTVYLITIRTLNGKQSDLSVKLPAALRSAEPACRTLLTDTLVRGKIELTVSADLSAPGATLRPRAQLNRDRLQETYREVSQALASVGADTPPAAVALLLNKPDLWIMPEETEADLSAHEEELLLAGVKQALRETEAFRSREGNRLQEILLQSVASIEARLEAIAPFEAARIADIRTRLTARLAELKEVDYDRGRLEQELIFYIEKLDVNEEKNRLAQHIHYFRETIDTPEKAIGKKLGFIAQEMGREINTLGSKSNQADMQRIVVEMKDHLEQIKEQVLNVL